jgi:hypothetical protein
MEIDLDCSAIGVPQTSLASRSGTEEEPFAQLLTLAK